MLRSQISKNQPFVRVFVTESFAQYRDDQDLYELYLEYKNMTACG